MFDFIAKLFFSEPSYIVWKAMEKREDWKVSYYVIKHKTSEIEMWTANGGFHFDGYGHRRPESFYKFTGILERHVLYLRALRVRKGWKQEQKQERREKVIEYLSKMKE